MTTFLWIGFLALIIALLALDLGVFHRRAHVIYTREALGWVGFWMTLAVLFGLAVYFMYQHHWLGLGRSDTRPLRGSEAIQLYLTGYLVEQSLSLDNIFVIAIIITYFRVPPRYQHRLLFWGILGALVMRGTMIVAGLALLRYLDWLTYVFGGLLLLAAAKMLLAGDHAPDPNHNPLVRLARRLYPVTPDYADKRFFTRLDGRRAVTPLFIALLLIESTDLLFAVDSIPAVFAVTTDPFLVFTSNVFAILGLRSLYFALAGLMDKFRYLKYSLVILLVFIAFKMLAAKHFHIPATTSLGIVAAILLTGIVSSLLLARRHRPA